MQQNAGLLFRRAPIITRSRPLLRLPPRPLPLTSRPHLRHRTQQRCISHRAAIGLHLGDLEFAHLGGRHYFRVRIPQGSKAEDIDERVRALDTCLPLHLRSDDAAPTEDQTSETLATRRDIALLLIQAKNDASLNLLEYLGVVQKRWDAVSWIVQMIAQPGLPRDIWATSSIMTPLRTESGKLSLDEFTSSSKWRMDAPPAGQPIDLQQATIDADPRFYDTRLQKGAMGQIWQSLGIMIMRAAEGTSDAQQVMPHVLSCLATLHHHGIVPESIYREAPDNSMTSLQQPPLLHMLSSKILTALSDAAWDARQVAVNDTERSGRGQYSPWRFGLESPGVRYRATPSQLRPEVWLELVLWSCLHGGWVEEGAALVERITQDEEERDHPWSLVCWRNIIESSNAQQAHTTSFGWRDALDILEGARPEAQPRPSADDKALVIRTVSSEVIAAYVDAMVGRVYVGVGQRGSRMRFVLDHVKQSKRMLNRQNLGLGFATWDVIVQRFMESGGLQLEQDLDLVQDILQLVDPFGKERELDNQSTSQEVDASQSKYFIGASALPLSLLHRILRARAVSGSIDGTMHALKVLQDFTELNQRRSIEQFFQSLKQQSQVTSTSATRQPRFDTGLAAAEYPSFYLQLPVHVLAPFLDVIQDVKDPAFHRWIFESKSATGPIFSSSMYKEQALAPALVRYASATYNQSLLEDVMTYHSHMSRENNAVIPAPMLSALIQTLIQRHKWSSVRTLVDSLMAQSRHEKANISEWIPRSIPFVIREMLRLKPEPQAQEGGEAGQLLVDLVMSCLKFGYQRAGFAKADLIFYNLSLLAAVDRDWGRFVRKMRVLPRRSIPTRVGYEGTAAFNVVLEGVLETRGLAAARDYWKIWCYSPSTLRRQRDKHDRYLVVPRVRPQEDDIADLDDRVTLQLALEYRIDLAGRVRPNFRSLRLMQRALEVHPDRAIEEWLDRYARAMGHVEDESQSKAKTTEDIHSI